jgi:hypothetical protein
MKNLQKFLAAVGWVCLATNTLALDPNSEENIKWWAGDESYTINLEGEMTLRDILDSGIRPRHVGAMGSHLLLFQSSSVEFVFSNGDTIQTKNGYGELYVGADHRIMNITFYENYHTGIDEAFDRMLEMMPSLDGGGITIKELRDNIERVRNAEDHWVAERFGIGTAKLDEFWRANVTASQSFNRERPFRFIFTMRRNYVNRDRERPERNPMGTLLEPPEGYEHISFEYVTTPTSPNAMTIPMLSPLEQAEKLSENIQKRNQTENKGDRISPSESDTDEIADIDLPEESSNRRSLVVIVTLIFVFASTLGIYLIGRMPKRNKGSFKEKESRTRR